MNQSKQTDQKEENQEHYSKQPNLQDRGPSKIRQQFSRGMTMFLVIVVCIIFYFVLLRLDAISNALGTVFNLVRPIVYGLVIAYLLNPIVKLLEKYLNKGLAKIFPGWKSQEKVCRGLGILGAYLILLAIVVALFNMLIPEIYRSIRSVISTVPSQMNDALKYFTEIAAQNSTLGQIFTSAMQQATEYIQNWMRTDLLDQANTLMSSVTVGVINMFSGILDALIGIIVSVYVLYGKENFSKQAKKIVYAVFNPVHANNILHLTSKSNEIFSGFIIGKVIDSVIMGVLCFIGLSILQMPYTVLVSVIVGVTNVIPFFGPYIGAIPSAILILLYSPRMGIYFIIFILILQQIDGNIIGPKILGNSTGLSPFWVIFAILLGSGLFGFPGLLLGVPTFAVIYYIVGVLIDTRLERKQLPTETDCYDEDSYVRSDGTFVYSDITTAQEEEEEKQHADLHTK